MKESQSDKNNDNNISLNSFNKQNTIKKTKKRKQIILKKNEVENKIFEAFPILQNESKFHTYFSSYDFHDNEQHMVHFWKEVLEYIIVHLKDDFAMEYGQIIALCRFKCIEPIGLNNIVKKLVNDGDFYTESELKSDEFYKRNFPDLYPKETWGQYFKKTITYSIWGSNENQPIENENLLIEKKSFLHHVDMLLELIKAHCEEIDQNVITDSELRNIIFDNEESLTYLDSNLDLCLTFLEKKLKIKIFDSEIDDKKIKCIKIMNSNDSQINIKDQALIRLNAQIKSIEKRIYEQECEMNNLNLKAKDYIKSREKDKAKKILGKRMIIKKSVENFYNVRDVLFEKLLSIKSMEATKNIKTTLEEVLKTCDKLKLDMDEFQNIKENFEDVRQQNNEVKDLFVNFAEENTDKDYIENELKDLYDSLEIDSKNEKKINKPIKVAEENVQKNIEKDKNEIECLLQKLEN